MPVYPGDRVHRQVGSGTTADPLVGTSSLMTMLTGSTIIIVDYVACAPARLPNSHIGK
jgi:hypothetical protein